MKRIRPFSFTQTNPLARGVVLAAFLLLAPATSQALGQRADASAPPAMPLSTQGNTLQALLKAFQKSPGIEASFTEEKHIALLAAPLKSEGKIFFHPPHSLARKVSKPRPSHLSMTGKKIVVKDEDGRREVDLSDKAALRGLVGSLLHVLAGDEKSLRKDYELKLSGSLETGWSLVLTPKSATLKKMIRSFSFSGKGLEMSKLVVTEASGDKSISHFSKVNTKRRFSPKDVARLFGI